MLTHEKICFRCWLAVVLLDVFRFVGDHTNERVKLNDRHTQVDDIHRISEETLQCRHKFCVGKLKWMSITSISASIHFFETSSRYLRERGETTENMEERWSKYSQLDHEPPFQATIFKKVWTGACLPLRCITPSFNSALWVFQICGDQFLLFSHSFLPILLHSLGPVLFYFLFHNLTNVFNEWQIWTARRSAEHPDTFTTEQCRNECWMCFSHRLEISKIFPSGWMAARLASYLCHVHECNHMSPQILSFELCTDKRLDDLSLL